MKQRLFLLFFISMTLFSNATFAAKNVIGILVFDGVLTSDITAPAEVFGNASKQSWFNDYEVRMISVSDQPRVTTEEGLVLNVDSHIGDPQNLSVLIVPSSYSMKPLLRNKTLIEFIAEQSKRVDWLASHCSGALLLAEAGVLNGKKATTWAGGESDFQKAYPAVLVQEDKNYVVDDNIITSNGSVVSYLASIKLLSLMTGEKLAQEVFDALQLGRITKSY